MSHNELLGLIAQYKANKLEEDVAVLTNLGMHLGHVFSYIQRAAPTFEGRTELFFVLFKEMLRRGHLKLQRDGKIIEHTPEEWEAIFRAVWPEYEEEPNPLPGYAPFTIDMWLAVEAPAFAVWVDPDDGTLEWAT